MVDRIRSRSQIPLIFMTYANVIYSYGPERFMERAKECGIYGVILPDVPYEEKAEFEGVCKANGIELISMIAPTSHDRIAAIARDAGGFVYCVSSLGVTGVRSEITTDIGAMVELVRKANPGIPVYIGFGISDTKTAREMAAVSDGVIVGSAIVKIIAEYGEKSIPEVEAFVRSMKEAANT